MSMTPNELRDVENRLDCEGQRDKYGGLGKEHAPASLTPVTNMDSPMPKLSWEDLQSMTSSQHLLILQKARMNGNQLSASEMAARHPAPDRGFHRAGCPRAGCTIPPEGPFPGSPA